MLAEMLGLLCNFRILSISGRFGGGKTSLGVWLAFLLLERNRCDKIGTNLTLNVGRVIDTPQTTADLLQHKDMAVIYDESWLELGTGFDRHMREWFAYPRKRNQYFLLPSVQPLVKMLTNFRVERQFNGYTLGLPLWLYKWQLGSGKKPYSGYYPWFRPSRVFPLYDHEAEPTGDYRIYKFDNEVMEDERNGDDQAQRQ